MITEATVPSLAPGMKLRHDAVRDSWVLLGPERMFVPDAIALEVLKLVDGVRSVGAIVDDLCARFAAPRETVAGDVSAMLDDLAAKGAVKL
jgi:pyrroloquinoline quinone biosynthesis protein D